MSGHSKWAQIKRQKAVTDKKRGNLFTKLGNAITIAAKQGDPNPEINFKLRMAIEKAKAANTPNENIERAIKRGNGELEGVVIEEVVYEGFGPAGTALIIEATTDNKNRTTASLRNILTKYQGNLGSSGSVRWMFDKKGAIRIIKDKIINKDELTLKLIDAGVEDIVEEEEGLTVYTTAEELLRIKELIEKEGIVPESAEIELVPQNKTKIEDESVKVKINKLFEELEAHDDINNYFTNADL